jgi:hypothetical protein
MSLKYIVMAPLAGAFGELPNSIHAVHLGSNMWFRRTTVIRNPQIAQYRLPAHLEDDLRSRRHNRTHLDNAFWRNFVLTDLIQTCGLSLIAFFTLTDRPATARWMSQDERDLAIARVKSERVGATEVRCLSVMPWCRAFAKFRSRSSTRWTLRSFSVVS